MFSFKNALIAFGWLLLISITPLKGISQDTLINIDDVEFSSGQEETGSTDTLISDLEGVEFSSGEDTAATDSTATVAPTVDSTDNQEANTSLWGIFIEGLLGGFLAFLMPCIFPMVPLTVSFFTKKSASKLQAVSQALTYGLFIIVIYVALGMLITIAFGPEAMNALSTNGIFNFFFFLMLVFFAASFFGAFEITLPSKFVNKIDEKSDKGGLIGYFFMAASLAVVSFSCTGPIIGTVLVNAAVKGDRLGPAIAMFGFSFALAIPFVLFAMFPALLKSMPKSGGWLNSVKVVLGFLELALALKFLSNVDLAYNWQFLDREVFLSLWIVIFGLMGLYLIGKIKFSHDSDLKYMSVPRTIIAIIVFSFVVYMVPGMWGAPLKSIAAFLPPIGTQDFDISAGVAAGPGHGTSADANNRKYFSHFHDRATIKGMDPYYDYDEALAAARAQDKPLLVDFTGWNCVNCRKMEADVWSDPGIKQMINENFILAELYVDDYDLKLPESEQFVSPTTGKKINTVGRKNTDFQISKFNSNSQPLYAMLDNDEQLLVPTSGANYNIESYRAYLQSAIDAYKAKK
ncbi:protein-disulfide reductase DsbD family protein [Sphingobacterium daejeonense]|uniref:protein-disulfide reductase DsbD family protein n=1 Tax=Sphingobacterium daejeonense TaxID=371142 RepID=UPI0010C5A1D9|nr:cytochrome c biogenesis protein CcdA [Sphingobacterium daejeonense]VTP87130.1 Thiol:disulfide interchange protein DsbD precursor [Sphingobacterium daejeonense]